MNDAQGPSQLAGEEGGPAERYRRGVASFDYGDCVSAISELEPVAVPGVLDDDKQLVDAYRILGVCYFQTSQRREAEGMLDALLYIEPNYELDPFRTPPPVSELYEERKAILQQKLKDIEAEQQRQKSEQPTGAVIIERERVVRQLPLPVIFLPLGLPQALNDDGDKALVIGILQGVLLSLHLGGSLAALVIDLGDGQLGSASRHDVVQQQSYSVAWIGSVLGLAGFVSAYAYGVVDGWWFRRETAELSSTETERRAEGEEARKLLRRLADEE
ncbi:MAG: hypothetical protein ACO3JL_05945 [Myxococcota bacterium]